VAIARLGQQPLKVGTRSGICKFQTVTPVDWAPNSNSNVRARRRLWSLEGARGKNCSDRAFLSAASCQQRSVEPGLDLISTKGLGLHGGKFHGAALKLTIGERGRHRRCFG